MFEKLIDKLGYIPKGDDIRNLKTNPFTEEELSVMLADILKTSDDTVDDAQEIKLFKELNGVEGLVEYLRETSNKDMRRYFGAVTKEEQLVIRGAYSRTNYFKTKVSHSGEVPKDKLESIRHK